MTRQPTTPKRGLSIPARIGLAVAALAIVMAGVASLAALFCRLQDPIDPATLPTGRIVYLLIDGTDSMRSFGERARALAGERVLSRIAPGDFIDALQIGSDVDRYDEGRYRVFIDAERLPSILAVPRRDITKDDLCPSFWCDVNRPFRQSFDKEVDRLEGLRRGWRAAMDEMRPPTNACCSGYLPAIRFVEQNAAGQKGERWLFVMGDLIHEGSKLPAPEPAEDAAPSPFSGFKVVLAHPSGAHDAQRAEQAASYWRAYFESRGAQVTVTSFEHFAGLPASPLAPPAAPPAHVARR